MRFLVKKHALQRQRAIQNPTTGKVKVSIVNNRRERKGLRRSMLIYIKLSLKAATFCFIQTALSQQTLVFLQG
jgi:hypothetical protein